MGKEKVAGEEFHRLYFGNEFCEKLIPDRDALERGYGFSRKEKKKFTFVTPFVTDEGLDRLGPLLVFLDRQKDAEIVFNDWGVFRLLKKHFNHLTPVLGRLLTKQRRDPMISDILANAQKTVVKKKGKKETIILPKKVPPSLAEHFRASVINVPVFQRFLLSQGIRRVEIDHLIWGMNISVPPEMGVSIYFPYGYVSTTRMCWRVSLSSRSCKRTCKKYFFRIKNRSLPVPFYSIGNTVFYRSGPVDLEKLKHLKKLRLVYQPRLPF